MGKEEAYNKILGIIKSEPKSEFTVLCAYNEIQNVVLEQQREEVYELKKAFTKHEEVRKGEHE